MKFRVTARLPGSAPMHYEVNSADRATAFREAKAKHGRNFLISVEGPTIEEARLADREPLKLPRLEGESKRRRSHSRTGFRDTYDYGELLEDMVAMIKLHLPQIEKWQAEDLAFDLSLGVRESRYWVVR